MKPLEHWEHRSAGVAGQCDEEPSGAIWEQAKAILAAKAKAKAEREAIRAAAPVPNRICYAETAFKDWKPGDPIPSCKKCKALLHPEDNHVCEGYIADPTRLNTALTFAERKAIRRAAWEEAGDWDDDQYDRTTSQEGGFDKMMHEAETGETYDQVVDENMTEDEWIMRRRLQLGHGPGYEMPDFEDFEDDV